ncbi:MAG: 50S ribosomal protein L22 [Pyrinomonadaceae bacterium]
MEATAKLRHLKGSPRKARLVIDLIRGRNVSQALNILKFTDKRAADPIAKTLRSAIANATFLAERQNIAIDPDDLFVKTCFVDMGAHKNRRRMRPAPQGRAYREQRHYCHITIHVSSDVPEENKRIILDNKAKGESGDKSSGEKNAESKNKSQKIRGKSDNLKETKKVKKEEAVVEEIETPTAEPNTESESAKATQASKATAEQTDAPNMPLAAQNDEEKTGTKPAEQAQLDINKRLERQ